MIACTALPDNIQRLFGCLISGPHGAKMLEYKATYKCSLPNHDLRQKAYLRGMRLGSGSGRLWAPQFQLITGVTEQRARPRSSRGFRGRSLARSTSKARRSASLQSSGTTRPPMILSRDLLANHKKITPQIGYRQNISVLNWYRVRMNKGKCRKYQLRMFVCFLFGQIGTLKAAC